MDQIKDSALTQCVCGEMPLFYYATAKVSVRVHLKEFERIQNALISVFRFAFSWSLESGLLTRTRAHFLISGW